MFLRHAAYAQTPVLAIFMGGMAIGAWLASPTVAALGRPASSPAAIADLEALPAALSDNLLLMRAALLDCQVTIPASTLQRALTDVAGLINQHLARADREAVWKLLAGSNCRVRLTQTERAAAVHAGCPHDGICLSCQIWSPLELAYRATDPVN